MCNLDRVARPCGRQLDIRSSSCRQDCRWWLQLCWSLRWGTSLHPAYAAVHWMGGCIVGGSNRAELWPIALRCNAFAQLQLACMRHADLLLPSNQNVRH